MIKLENETFFPNWSINTSNHFETKMLKKLCMGYVLDDFSHNFAELISGHASPLGHRCVTTAFPVAWCRGATVPQTKLMIAKVVVQW